MFSFYLKLLCLNMFTISKLLHFCFYILTKNQQTCQIKKMATTKNNINYYIMKVILQFLVHLNMLNACDSSPLGNLTVFKGTSPKKRRNSWFLILDKHVKNKKHRNSISSLTGKCAAQKIKNFCTFSLWTCLHHMVILRSQNKITIFFMILAWASPFNYNIYGFSIYTITMPAIF